MLTGFEIGGVLYNTAPIPSHKFMAVLITSPQKAPNELANLQNIPNEITPNKGPPSIPKIDKEICNTVALKYWQKYAIPTVIKPNKAAISFDIKVALDSPKSEFLKKYGCNKSFRHTAAKELRPDETVLKEAL